MIESLLQYIYVIYNVCSFFLIQRGIVRICPDHQMMNTGPSFLPPREASPYLLLLSQDISRKDPTGHTTM